jgi:hypothetical protein
MAISFMGIVNSTNNKTKTGQDLMLFFFGTLIYFGNVVIFQVDYSATSIYILYLISTLIGFLFMMTGGSRICQLFQNRFGKNDIFNSYNETFPQEERLIENEFSINLRATYRYRNQIRKSWINIVNPMRGTLICGTPGSGKTYFVVEQIIEQHIRKGFAMVIYDFKYPEK